MGLLAFVMGSSLYGQDYEISLTRDAKVGQQYDFLIIATTVDIDI
jgi:hypothetical protein